MNKIRTILKKLGWKWRILFIVSIVIVAVIVLTPTIYYLLREREAPDYSDIVSNARMTYHVAYDSGDGMVNESTFVVKVVENHEDIDSHSVIYTVTEMDPLPKRSVNAIIVGSATVTLAANEIYRSADDLRVLINEVMQVDLPLVNTAISTKTFSDYNGYPGWPYSKGDTWTYTMFVDPDTSLQPKYTDTYRAEVVEDDAFVIAADAGYECFKVVHTLIDTDNKTPAGIGIGSTRIEYWVNTGKYIAPIKIEDGITYKGIDTRTMMDADPPPGSW